MKRSLSRAAIAGFRNDSRCITWHQTQVEKPMERKTGLFARFASAKASGPQGRQSTRSEACWRRYGLFSLESRLGRGASAAIDRGTERINHRDTESTENGNG